MSSNPTLCNQQAVHLMRKARSLEAPRQGKTEGKRRRQRVRCQTVFRLSGHAYVYVLVTGLHLTLFDPMDWEAGVAWIMGGLQSVGRNSD